jgi:hypothetical protein
VPSDRCALALRLTIHDANGQTELPLLPSNSADILSFCALKRLDPLTKPNTDSPAKTYSSCKIERACYEDLAFRVLTGNLSSELPLA